MEMPVYEPEMDEVDNEDTEDLMDIEFEEYYLK